jgi:hypothetical protein
VTAAAARHAVVRAEVAGGVARAVRDRSPDARLAEAADALFAA